MPRIRSGFGRTKLTAILTRRRLRANHIGARQRSLEHLKKAVFLVDDRLGQLELLFRYTVRIADL